MSAVFQLLDDWLNPIVVKELRQAVRSRFLIGVLILLLLAQLLVLGVTLMSQGSDFNWIASRAGGSYFFALFAVLLGVGLIFMPLYSGFRMGLERQTDNSDLLYITALTPRDIVLGKLTSTLLLVAWIYSACAPFMLVSFLLRGISLPIILLILAVAFLIIMMCVQGGILLGSLAVPRVLKGLLGLGFMSFLFGIYGATVSMSQMAVKYGNFRLFSRSRGSASNNWLALLVMTLGALAITGLLFVLTEAVLKPPSANRMFSVRVYLSVMWLVTLITAVLIASDQKSFAPMFFWFLATMGVMAFSFLLNFSERERLGRRIRRSVPTSPAKRTIAFPFFSGIASGFTWTLIVSLLSIIVMYALFSQNALWKYRNDFGNVVNYGGVGFLLMIYAYCATAYAIRRLVFPNLRNSFSWLFVILVFALCVLLPFLLAIVSGSVSNMGDSILVMTPLGLVSNKVRNGTVILGLIWAIATTPFLIGIFNRSRQEFKPLTGEEDKGNAEFVTDSAPVLQVAGEDSEGAEMLESTEVLESTEEVFAEEAETSDVQEEVDDDESQHLADEG